MAEKRVRCSFPNCATSYVSHANLRYHFKADHGVRGADELAVVVRMLKRRRKEAKPRQTRCDCE